DVPAVTSPVYFHLDPPTEALHLEPTNVVLCGGPPQATELARRLRPVRSSKRLERSRQVCRLVLQDAQDTVARGKLVKSPLLINAIFQLNPRNSTTCTGSDTILVLGVSFGTAPAIELSVEPRESYETFRRRNQINTFLCIRCVLHSRIW